MIIPWQELEEQTLINIVESVILREGTDYGLHEQTFEQKKKALLNRIPQIQRWTGFYHIAIFINIHLKAH